MVDVPEFQLGATPNIWRMPKPKDFSSRTNTRNQFTLEADQLDYTPEQRNQIDQSTRKSRKMTGLTFIFLYVCALGIGGAGLLLSGVGSMLDGDLPSAAASAFLGMLLLHGCRCVYDCAGDIAMK